MKNKYLSTISMAARTHDYFGLANLIGNYLVRILRLTALIMIWRELFSRGADTGGMTLERVLTYTYMSAVLEPLLDVRTPASSWLHEGTIMSNFMRPMGIFTQLTLHTVGSWLQSIIFFSIPALIAAPLLGIRVSPESGWAYLALILTVSEGFAVDYLFSCLMIRMKNMSWTVEMLRNALTALLTGAVIPFELLPWGLGRYLEYTPLGTLAGGALAVWTGADNTAAIIVMQIIWNACLWPAAACAFRRSRERMVAYGG